MYSVRCRLAAFELTLKYLIYFKVFVIFETLFDVCHHILYYIIMIIMIIIVTILIMSLGAGEIIPLSRSLFQDSKIRIS